MAFTFNSNDIQAPTKQLAFGGDYLVKVQSAEYQGTEDNQQRKTYGADKFHVVFEVMDGTEISVPSITSNTTWNLSAPYVLRCWLSSVP